MKCRITTDIGSGDGIRTFERSTLAITGPAETLAPFNAGRARVLADIRQRIADGEARPVLARHMQALGLDDVLLALAREG
jgi:hypothetical protein